MVVVWQAYLWAVCGAVGIAGTSRILIWQSGGSRLFSRCHQLSKLMWGLSLVLQAPWVVCYASSNVGIIRALFAWLACGPVLFRVEQCKSFGGLCVGCPRCGCPRCGQYCEHRFGGEIETHTGMPLASRVYTSCGARMYCGHRSCIVCEAGS